MSLIPNVALRWYTYRYARGSVSFSQDRNQLANTNNRGPCFPTGAIVRAVSNKIAGSSINAGGILTSPAPNFFSFRTDILASLPDMSIGEPISNPDYEGRQRGDVIILSSEKSTVDKNARYDAGMMLDGYNMIAVTNVYDPVGKGIRIVNLHDYYASSGAQGIDYYRANIVEQSLVETGFEKEWTGDDPKYMSYAAALYIACYLESRTPANIIDAGKAEWLDYMQTSCYDQKYANTLVDEDPKSQRDAFKIAYKDDKGYGLFNLPNGKDMTIEQQIETVLENIKLSSNGITNSGLNNGGAKVTIGQRRVGDPQLRTRIDSKDVKKQEKVVPDDHPARQVDTQGNALLYVANQYVESNSMLVPLHLPSYFRVGGGKPHSTSNDISHNGGISPSHTKGTGKFMNEAVNYDFKLTIDKVVDWIISNGSVGRFKAWCNNDRTKCTQVLEAVQAAGMSPAWFAAYESQENGNGLASQDSGGTYDWLNARYIGGSLSGEPPLTGDPVQDAANTAKILLPHASSTTPAGGFGVNTAAAAAAMQQLPTPSIGRLYVAATAAAAAELINQDIGYGKPMAACSAVIISMGGTL